MGQHKIKGASKGKDYKKDQEVSLTAIVNHKDNLIGKFSTSDSKNYIFDDRGAIHRIKDTVA